MRWQNTGRHVIIKCVHLCLFDYLYVYGMCLCLFNGLISSIFYWLMAVGIENEYHNYKSIDIIFQARNKYKEGPVK